MSLILCPHESGQTALLNTEDQTYIIIPVTTNKYFSNGRMFDFYESVDDFLNSESPAAVIAFYCTDRKNKGRRYVVTLTCRSTTTEIYNVEKTPSGWLKNERDAKGWDKSAPAIGVEVCEPCKAYFIYCVKEKESTTGFRVKAVKLIEK